MGKTRTPKYRIELKFMGKWDHYPWKSAWGKPTETVVKAVRDALNESFKAGGLNEHVSKNKGVLVSYSDSRAIEQATGEVVAEYQAPMFEVI